MEKTALDDKKVLRVLRTLYRTVKKAAKKKKLLPLIGIFSVRFDDKGKVLFDVSGDTADLSEALRRVGVTVYQTFAGVSEFTDESFIVDGYDNRPLNTVHWFLVGYLLHHGAHDLMAFETLIGWRSAIRRWFDEKKAKRSAEKEALLQEQKAKWEARKLDVKDTERALKIAGRSMWWRNFTDGIIEWLGTNKSNFVSGLLIALCAIEIVVFWLANWPWSAPFALALFSLVFICAILAEFIAWKWLSYSDTIRVAVILLVMIFFAMSSVYTVSLSLNLPEGKNRNMVLINRDTGALVGRLPNDIQDKFLTWNKSAIPLFRYRIEQGLPLAQKQQFELVFGDKELKFSAAFKVDAYYALIDQTAAAYVLAWDYWRTPENLTVAAEELFEMIKEKTRQEFESEIENYHSGAKEFGAREAKALFKKLDKEIRFYFRAYRGNLFCYNLIMAFTETPYYNFAEARLSDATVQNDAGDIQTK